MLLNFKILLMYVISHGWTQNPAEILVVIVYTGIMQYCVGRTIESCNTSTVMYIVVAVRYM